MGRMSPVGIRNAICQVIEGLKFLHSQGFLHRDIKPENIFISALTPPFDATLGDLGILSPVDAIGRGAGTRTYKAPEVYCDDLQSSATDVYALGVTLLHMVDERARKGGYEGMTKWINDIRDHPPPAPYTRLIMQMLAPYPPSLRPTLDIIQKHLLQQKDLPESVQLPEYTFKEAMEMLERRAQSALANRQVVLVDPMTNPDGPLPQPTPLENCPKSRKNVLRQNAVLDNPITGRPNPLEIVHRGRNLATHDPTTVESGFSGPFQLQLAKSKRHRGRGPMIFERKIPGPSVQQAAVDMVREAQFLACHDPWTFEQQVPGPARRRRPAYDSRPAAAQKEPEQYPLTQAVDFSQRAIEPDNPFTRQDRELLGAEIKQNQAQPLPQKHRHHRRQAVRQRHGPIPGAWPSGSTQSGSSNLPRTSQLSGEASGDPPNLPSPRAPSELDSGEPDQNTRRGVLRRQHGGVRRPTRARVDTHARHDERPNKHKTASWQRRLLDGLLLAYSCGAGTIWNALPGFRRFIGG